MVRLGVAGGLGLALALVLGLAFGLIGFLAYEKQRKAYAGLVHARIAAVAIDLGAAAEAGLNIGLPLPAMVNLQELFQREAAVDAAILSIDAFDAEGRVVHSSDAARIGALAAQRWAPAAGGGRLWRLEESDAFVNGVSLRNSFDGLEGALAVRYDRRAYDAGLAETAWALAWRLALVFAVCAAFVAGGAGLLLRREAA